MFWPELVSMFNNKSVVGKLLREIVLQVACLILKNPTDLISTMPKAESVENSIVVFEVFTMSKTPRLFCNLHWTVMVLKPSVIFTIAVPDKLAGNGAMHFTNLLQPGLRLKFSRVMRGTALLRNLNSEFLGLSSPSSSCIFFMPSTRSIVGCISDTKASISNLCPAILSKIGITKWAFTSFSFPTLSDLIVDFNFGKPCRILFLSK